MEEGDAMKKSELTPRELNIECIKHFKEEAQDFRRESLAILSWKLRPEGYESSAFADMKAYLKEDPPTEKLAEYAAYGPDVHREGVMAGT